VNSYVGYLPTTTALTDLLTGRQVEAGAVPAALPPGPAAAASRLGRWSAARHGLARVPTTPVTTTPSQLVQLPIGPPRPGRPPPPTSTCRPATPTHAPPTSATRWST